MHVMRVIPAVPFLVTLLAAAAPADAGAPATLQRASTQPGQTTRLSPRDAGRRGGEAAGAVYACDWLRITQRAATLRSQYEGDALAEFDAEASRILAAWHTAKTCRNAGGPNECRITLQLSCQEALREIGPDGSALPGLLEPK